MPIKQPLRRIFTLALALLFTTAAMGDYAAAAIDTQFFDSNKILYYDPTACDPNAGSGSGTLTGNSEAEKIWNWLVGNGLSDQQAAGVMGNMQAESGFVPTRHQGTGEVWNNDFTGNAWGLVQWDGGRRFTSPDRGVLGALRKDRPALEKYVDIQYDYARHPDAKASIPEKDLDALILFELDYMKQESQSRPTTARGFGNAGSEWETLKEQDTIEDATVFWHNNFEVSSDSAEEVIRNRGGFAQDAYDSFAGTTPAASDDTASKITVFLDPGHGGAIPDYTDEKTGILTNETDNSPEREDALDVANQVRSQLEEAGYTVVMARTTNTAKVTFRERANAAAAAKASIGISIHTTPNAINDAWPQHDGYREYQGNRDTFGDTDEERATIEKSQAYATAVAQARTESEGRTVSTDPDSSHQAAAFGRGGNIKSPGNIPLVALWSPTVPWVYNEIQQDGAGASITAGTKAAYAEGIVNGVKKALPAPAQSGDCSGENFAGGNFNETLLAYAWPQYHEPNYLDKTPAYANAVSKARSEGRYVGGGVNPGIDCGGFVTTLLVDSGFEPDYNYGSKLADGAGNTTNQQAWMRENWESLGASDGMNAADLQPGDVAINSSHTFVFVGEVEGFDSDVASASYSPSNTSWRSPMAGPEAPNKPGFTWYRKK